MKVGVCIDGVLRNFLGRVEEVHEKYFPPKEGEKEIEVLDYDLEKWLTFPEEEVKQSEMEFNPDFNEEEFMSSSEEVVLEKKIDKTTVEEFLYEKCTLEIFGYANEEISSGVDTLNNLILENPEYEFYLISREVGLSVPSTLFFLSKTKCMVQNIKFIKEFKSFWDFVDVGITDRPEIIKSKPKNKVCVKVNKNYNDSYDSDFTIKSIKEVDSDFIKNLALS